MSELWDDDEGTEVAGVLVDTAPVKAETRRITEEAALMVIVDRAGFDRAATFAAECARCSKLVDQKFAEVDDKTKKAKAATDAARSEVLALIRELKAPFEEAKKVVDKKAMMWQRAENDRLALEAELKRREEQKRLDEQRAVAVEAAKAAGAQALASAIMETPAQVAQVEVSFVAPPKGTTYSSRWVGRCTDKAALIRAVAEGLIHADVLDVSQKEIDAWAKQTKGSASVPGLVAEDVGMVSHR